MSKSQPGQVHCLKCWPEFYELMMLGVKPFEYRKNDRCFEVGDDLVEQEWCPRRRGFTGRVSMWRVNLIVREAPGLPEGYCIMAVSPTAIQEKVPSEYHSPQPHIGYLGASGR